MNAVPKRKFSSNSKVPTLPIKALFRVYQENICNLKNISEFSGAKKGIKIENVLQNIRVF